MNRFKASSRLASLGNTQKHRKFVGIVSVYLDKCIAEKRYGTLDDLALLTGLRILGHRSLVLAMKASFLDDVSSGRIARVSVIAIMTSALPPAYILSLFEECSGADGMLLWMRSLRNLGFETLPSGRCLPLEDQISPHPLIPEILMSEIAALAVEYKISRPEMIIKIVRRGIHLTRALQES